MPAWPNSSPACSTYCLPIFGNSVQHNLDLMGFEDNKCGSGHRKIRVCVIKKPLRSSLICYFSHRRTNKRTNTRPKNIYFVYSRRFTTFVFRCSLNSWFLRIFDIFSRDRQTYRQTDRPIRVGIEAPSPELKKG